MESRIECPKCGCSELDLHDFESMIVILETHALFTVRCPHCGARISSVKVIPDDMVEDVQFAAIEVGAGMGHSI